MAQSNRKNKQQNLLDKQKDKVVQKDISKEMPGTSNEVSSNQNLNRTNKSDTRLTMNKDKRRVCNKTPDKLIKVSQHVADGIDLHVDSNEFDYSDDEFDGEQDTQVVAEECFQEDEVSVVEQVEQIPRSNVAETERLAKREEYKKLLGDPDFKEVFGELMKEQLLDVTKQKDIGTKGKDTSITSNLVVPKMNGGEINTPGEGKEKTNE